MPSLHEVAGARERKLGHTLFVDDLSERGCLAFDLRASRRYFDLFGNVAEHEVNVDAEGLVDKQRDGGDRSA